MCGAYCLLCYTDPDGHKEKIMDLNDIEAAISLLVDEMEGEQGDRHEIFMRIQQMLSTMRAEGLPVPEDLVRLEAELAAEFEADLKD